MKMEHPLQDPQEQEKQPLNQSNNKPKYNVFHLIKLTLITAIGGFLFGYDTGVIAGANLYLKNDFKDITSFQKETIVSVAMIGAAIASLSGGVLSDKIGRKPTILIADILFTIGAILMGVAPSIPVLIIGRFVVGCGVGLAAMVVPVYLAEQAPQEIRGKLVTVNVIFITGGQFLATIICLSLGEQWRLMLGLAGIPSFLQFVFLLTMDESPSWLQSRQKEEEAENALKKIYPEDELLQRYQVVKEEAQHIQLEQEQPFFNQIGTLFMKYRRNLIVGVMLMVWQQLCGINTAMYYGPEILKKAFGGNEGEDQQAYKALLYSLPLSGMNTVGTIVATFFIDRFGRRFILLRTIPWVALALFLVSFGFYQHNYVDSSGDNTGTYIIFFSIIAYLAAFSVGLGCTPWTVNSEIYPLNLRGVGNSLSTFSNWVSNWALSAIFLTATEGSLGQVVTFGGLGVVCVFAFLFIFFFLPETKGKSFEEILYLFRSRDKNDEDINYKLDSEEEQTQQQLNNYDQNK